jgi:hypothetical protein
MNKGIQKSKTIITSPNQQITKSIIFALMTTEHLKDMRDRVVVLRRFL